MIYNITFLKSRKNHFSKNVFLVHQLDTKVSAKRAPLLATENQSPAKKPTSNLAAQARKEKLARLAQNLRSMEKADRGESPSPPPTPSQQSHPRKRVSGNWR